MSDMKEEKTELVNPAEVQKKVKDATLQKKQLSKEEMAKYKAIAKAMEMPIKVKNGDLKLGKRELDIRGLNKKNLDQLQFRNLVIQTAHLNDISQSLIDIQRLLMVLLKKLGVEDISSAITELMVDLAKEIKN